MEKSEKQDHKKNKITEIETFPVPLNLVKIKENISIITNAPSKPSKEKIINQAFKYHSQGNMIEATKYYQSFVNQGYEDHRVFSNYGMILRGLGKLKEAELILEKAIQIDSNFAIAHYNLGNVLRDIGNLKKAESSFRRTIKLNPNLANAHLNLGNILRDLSKLKEAEISLLKAIKLKPDFAIAYLNLGNILKDLGRIKEAETSLRKAIKIDTNFANAHSNLGAILIDLKKLKEAETSTRKAIELNPYSIEAYLNLGKILRKQSKFEELNSIYLLNEKKWKYDLDFYFMFKLLLSPIPLNRSEIDIQRKYFKRAISFINQNHKYFYIRLDVTFPIDIFYLAYQNHFDDRSILEDHAASLSKIEGIVNKSFNRIDQLNNLSKRTKIRIGICSDFLYQHTIGLFFTNLISDLASSGIEIIIFRGPSSKKDELSKKIDSFVSESIDLPKSHNEGCKTILSKSLDILFYPDLGMSSYTYLLSLSRLALIQVTSVGHPNTSGSPMIDYYISSKDLETSFSNNYYSEKLIRLSRLTCNHSKREIINSTFRRSSLNLPENTFLIGLPHSLFKIHPDYDDILEQILKEIPNSFLFLINDSNYDNTERFKSRWKKKEGLLLNRSIFHPRVNRCDFLEIIKSVDIVLDPIYFGMGNTFYDSMQFGTPVVTMPNDFHRTRNCFAGYKQMDIKNAPIASNKEEYIILCKKLAYETEYRDHIISQIINKSKKYLFNDHYIYKEYIDFFVASINSAKEGKLLDSNWTPKESI